MAAMFNPFDLPGPQFLLFYLLFGIGVNLWLRFGILGGERDDPSARTACSDPYKLAALRAARPYEALRLAIFSLVDRGLLKASGDEVIADKHASGIVKRPLEQAVVAFFSTSQKAHEIFTATVPLKADREYLDQLASEGLLKSSATMEKRGKKAILAMTLLMAVAAIKIAVALMRGKSNIGFLIILAIAFLVWTLLTWDRKRTGAGDEVLKIAKLRFSSLKSRAASLRPGGMSTDAVYLAAVFGLSSLPAENFPFVQTLFPKAATASSDNGSYSGGCGGGEGGSGGDSGGGGCGGCGGGGCGG